MAPGRASALEIALELARQGLPVFPCGKDKKPAISKEEGGRGFHDATTDAAIIRVMFNRQNAILVGMPTGEKSGFDVLDTDPRHDGHIWEAANEYRLPETRMHQTGGGGHHRLFETDPRVRNSEGRIASGVDVRGTGGYIIFPPSEGYAVIHEADLAPWPDWLLRPGLVLPVPIATKPAHTAATSEKINDKRLEAYVESLLTNVKNAPEGQKHPTLRAIARTLGGIQQQAGFTDQSIWERLKDSLPDTVEDWEAAKKTTLWALSKGRDAPITLEDRPHTNGHHYNGTNGTAAPPSYIEDAPPPSDETSYGLIELKNNGAPTIEELPPEFTDDAIALHFSELHGKTLRYIAAWGRWYNWTEAVWRHDSTLKVYDLCRRICRSYAVNAPPSVQKTITSGKTIAAVEKLIRTDRRHAATVDQWDADPWLLNTPQGVIDLRTREMLAHDPSHHMTKCTTVAPDDANCPRWLAFLNRICGDDQNLIAYIQRVCGYCLTGITREHAMFFGYGTGRNGKGVLLNTVVWILGDYAMTSDPDTFTEKGIGKHLTVLARLQGARLVVAQETEEGTPWAEARVKSITGGDPITANYMRQDPFTYVPQFKLFMAGNHKPGLRAVDEAIRARFNLIPFNVTIPVADRDTDLSEKLKAEGPAILRWMIDGCWDWQHLRLAPPPIVANATAEYFDAEDAMGLWMAEACELGDDNYQAAGDLYKSWKAWAASTGEPPLSQKRFSQSLQGRGYLSKKSDGKREVKGIRLKVPRPRQETENDRE